MVLLFACRKPGIYDKYVCLTILQNFVMSCCILCCSFGSRLFMLYCLFLYSQWMCVESDCESKFGSLDSLNKHIKVTHSQHTYKVSFCFYLQKKVQYYDLKWSTNMSLLSQFRFQMPVAMCNSLFQYIA